MKVAVIGSREFKNYNMVQTKLDKLNAMKKITAIVSGGAKGADTLAETYAEQNNIPTIIHLPKWDDLTHPDALIKVNKWKKEYDARAGFRRNKYIVDDADIVIAFQINKSKGTQDSIDYAKQTNTPVKVFAISM